MTDSILTLANATSKTYTGFTAPNTQTVIIAADGGTVVDYYYTRNKYTFTLGEKRGVDVSESTQSGEYYYGETIILKAIANEGYEVKGWSNGDQNNETSFRLGAENTEVSPIVSTPSWGPFILPKV